MAFADPLVITYNSVSKSLPRVNQDNRGSEYFLDDGTMKFTATIKHTVPAPGVAGESHLMRLDVDHYDAEGNFLRRIGAWLSTKSYDGEQVTADSDLAVQALVDLATDANIDKLLGREV